MSDPKAPSTPLMPVGEGNHVVRRGEGIASIAFAKGHFWRTLWNDPANAALREARGVPEVLLPGDRVMVPPLRSKTAEVATGARHVFRRKGVPSRLQVRLVADGAPRAGLAYKLYVAGETREGVIDGEGWIREWVPPDAERATLTLADGTSFSLALGTLYPIGDPRGQRQRLTHLDLLARGEDTPTALAQAIERFQRLQGIAVSGRADDETLARLVTVHGS